MVVSIAAIAYFVVAAVFFVMTYFEGWSRRDGWDAYRVLGLVLCTVWPLLVLYIFFDAGAARRTLAHGSPGGQRG
jgi:Ca2+/Na+ antiporter